MALALIACGAGIARAQNAAVIAEVDRVMEVYRLDAHIPGMVWGIVKDGRLVHVKGAGIQDIEAKRPVTPETLFRIASMTKAFTALSILKLRDEGKLSLDAPVETYVPELRGWKYPTDDAPKIRVRDLLTHTAGFVTDDPWGDWQTPMPEEEFSRLLKEGVPFTRGPGLAMEYQPRLRPPRPHRRQRLGPGLQGFRAQPDLHAARDGVDRLRRRGLAGGTSRARLPLGRRRLEARADDGARRVRGDGRHPDQRHRLREVGRLSALGWPARDGVDAGPVRRSSVRELATGANFPALRVRAGATGATACRLASTYAMGLIAAADCDLGLTLSHGGGYPGYGSHVLLLPDYGIGIFAFANRTYAGPRPPVWDAAIALTAPAC